MLLYYITDRSRFPGPDSGRRTQLLDRITAAADANVDYIQLREKDLPARELESLAHAALVRIRKAGTATRLLINTRSDVAIAVGAHGVHLPANAISAAHARKVFAAGGIAHPEIAVSCHTVEEVTRAQQDGADLIAFGPVFEKMDSMPAGLESLASAATAAPKKVFALGGVSVENAQQCRLTGAVGVAGIRLFQLGDIHATIASLRANAER